MLRSIISSCRQFAIATHQSEPILNCHLLRRLSLSDYLLKSNFHTSCCIHIMGKEVRSKKRVVEMAAESKLDESLTMPSDVDDVSGLTEAGITIPTLETMSMLVNGVPYNELPIAHIKSSPNNTIIFITDHTGNEFIAKSSCGQEGFKNVKKSTNVAAQATGLTVGLKIFRMGLRNIRVIVKGLGSGRLASIKGLQMGGLNIVSITDRTTVPHDAPRPRKARRL